MVADNANCRRVTAKSSRPRTNSLYVQRETGKERRERNNMGLEGWRGGGERVNNEIIIPIKN